MSSPLELNKPRSDSAVDNLPPEQLQQLEHWLFEEKPRVTYKKASERLLSDFSVRIAPSSLCEWWKRRARQRMLERIAKSRESSSEVKELVKQSPLQSFDALLELVGEAAFELKMNNETLDIETLKDLSVIAAIGLKARADTLKGQHKERELQLQVEKFKQQLKTDLEKGLDALFEEIKGNKEALEVFQKFKAVVSKATQ